MKASKASPEITVLNIAHTVEFWPEKEISAAWKMFVLNVEELAPGSEALQILVFVSGKGLKGIGSGAFNCEPRMASIRVPAELGMIFDN